MTIVKLPNGTRLGGRFEIQGSISSGGFAITYLAKDHQAGSSDDRVVIKEHAQSDVCYRDTEEGRVWPHPGKEDLHRRLCERIRKEAEHLASVRNPHVVDVHLVWEERGTAYIAMAALKGETLAEAREAAPAPFSEARWRWVRTVTLQLASALQAAHDKLIYHCDIKPSNVIITPSGVVLIDFGAARTLEQALRTVTLIPFTPGYAAPELHSPTTVAEVGPATDLYALGMIVYGLVVGHGESGVPVDAMARLRGPDPYAGAARTLEKAGLPRRWAKAIQACLALNAGGRPQSVFDLKKQLGEDGDEALGKPLPPLGDSSANGRPDSAATSDRPDPGQVDVARGEPGEGSGTRTSSGDAVGPPSRATSEGTRSDGSRVPPPPVTRRPATRPSRSYVVGALLVTISVVIAVLASRKKGTLNDKPPDSTAPVAVLTQDPDPTETRPLPAVGPQCVGPYYYECKGHCQRVRDWAFQCGRCGQPCELPNARDYDCVQGECSPKACEDPWANCDSVAKNGCETDLETSAQSCGACGKKCDVTANVDGVACHDRECAVDRCKEGFENCNSKFEDGCEINVADGDAANCNGCGRKCDAPNVQAHACVARKCEIQTCTEGFANCNASARDGCEISLKASAENCGACGTSCLGKPHTTGGGCRDGLCELVCSAGFDNCDKDLNNGCEASLKSDDDCGACGTSCKGRPYAAGGKCNDGRCKLSCEPGRADCNEALDDGCEIDTTSTPEHCGRCDETCVGRANASGGVCQNGRCALSCDNDYVDCDGSPKNGCEINQGNDPENCGGCGKKCSTNHTAIRQCVGGTCAFTCKDSFTDADGSPENGCEAPPAPPPPPPSPPPQVPGGATEPPPPPG